MRGTVFDPTPVVCIVFIVVKLSREEAVKCALVSVSIHWMCRLAHVLLKGERERGCSDTQISKDWRGTEGERVRVIEVEGVKRMTT